MPTIRFEKLKAKKKQLVLDSVRDSLEKHDIATLSVKDIADEAEISRGTFYTYFADIKDCVLTLIVHYLNKFFEILKSATKENEGNFFKTVEEQYASIMDFLSNDKCLSFIRNIASSMDFKIVLDYFNNLNKYSESIYKWFLEETDVGQILKERYKIFSFMTLLTNIMLTAIVELSMGVSRKEIDKEIKFKLGILSSYVNK